MPLKLDVVVASTRPGRVGVHVGRWFHELAQAHGVFDAIWVDLADVALPMYDEPKHPRLRDYQHEHTRRWSATVDEADAFVFVTPEYNFSPTPALINAIDYLSREWAYKPVAFVSYGGVSGGLRAVQVTKLILSAVKSVPINETVVVPFVAKQVHEGNFSPNEVQVGAATDLLDELSRWAEALMPLRAG